MALVVQAKFFPRATHLLALVCIGIAVLVPVSLAQTPNPGFVITVFPLTPPSITAPTGGTATATIMFTSVGGFTDTIRSTCVVTAGPSPAPSCADPAPVVVPSGSSGFTTLTVTTNSATHSGDFTFKVRAGDSRDHGPLAGNVAATLSVQHSYGVGNAGGGGIAISVLAALLILWSAGSIWHRKSAESR